MSIPFVQNNDKIHYEYEDGIIYVNKSGKYYIFIDNKQVFMDDTDVSLMIAINDLKEKLENYVNTFY